MQKEYQVADSRTSNLSAVNIGSNIDIVRFSWLVTFSFILFRPQ